MTAELERSEVLRTAASFFAKHYRPPQEMPSASVPSAPSDPLEIIYYRASSIAAPKTPALSPNAGLSNAASNVGLKIDAVILRRVSSV